MVERTNKGQVGADSLTVFKNNTCKINIVYRNTVYKTIADFTNMMKEKNWDNELIPIAEDAIALAKKHIGLQ